MAGPPWSCFITFLEPGYLESQASLWLILRDFVVVVLFLEKKIDKLLESYLFKVLYLHFWYSVINKISDLRFFLFQD